MKLNFCEEIRVYEKLEKSSKNLEKKVAKT